MSVYLQDAFDVGARLLVDADIHEVEIEDGRSTGVRGTIGHTL